MVCISSNNERHSVPNNYASLVYINVYSDSVTVNFWRRIRAHGAEWRYGGTEMMVRWYRNDGTVVPKLWNGGTEMVVRWYRNCGTEMVVRWYRNDGTVVPKWWYGGTEMMVRWYRNDGTVVSKWWYGGTETSSELATVKVMEDVLLCRLKYTVIKVKQNVLNLPSKHNSVWILVFYCGNIFRSYQAIFRPAFRDIWDPIVHDMHWLSFISLNVGKKILMFIKCCFVLMVSLKHFVLHLVFKHNRMFSIKIYNNNKLK